MASHIVIGALDAKTFIYTMPQFASKLNIYICPDCNEELILKQGNILAWHFSHKKYSNCLYYSHPSESQQHLAAKHLIKAKLEHGSIIINRECQLCHSHTDKQILSLENSDTVELECRFDYNGLKIADIAICNNDKIKYIIEIVHTHKTLDNARPDPWFELDATECLTLDALICKRYKQYCSGCMIIKYIWLNKHIDTFTQWLEWQQEFYVRFTLGQRIFKNNNWHDEEHERFDFDACENTCVNDNIINKFNKVMKIKPPYIQITTYFAEGVIYFYWTSMGKRLCELNVIEYRSCGNGTVKILTTLIKYINNIKLLARKIKTDLPLIASRQGNKLIETIAYLQNYHNMFLLITCAKCTKLNPIKPVKQLCIKCYVKCKTCNKYDRTNYKNSTCSGCFCHICKSVKNLCICWIDKYNAYHVL